MRESIGSLGLTTIVIFFLLLFSGYMSISINTNKAYKVKNEIITLIQKNNGVDQRTIDEIQDYMTKVGYRTTGECENGSYGFGSSGYEMRTNKALFCIKPMEVSYDSTQFPNSVYYEVKVFFALDLPVINNVFRFNLKGSTKKLYYPCTFDNDCRR